MGDDPHMKHWRRRLLLLCSLVFLTGLLSGVVLADLREGRSGPEGPHAAYIRRLSEALDLSPDQKVWLGIVLRERDRNKNDWLRRHLKGLSPEGRDFLREENRRADRRIEAMLTGTQRAEYRRLCAEESPVR